MPARLAFQSPNVPVATPRQGVRLDLIPGQQLRDIIQDAITRRRVVDAKGRSKVQCRIPMMRLQAWMERNPWPSIPTVRSFPLLVELQLVMPASANSRQLIDRAIKLIHNS